MRRFWLAFVILFALNACEEKTEPSREVWLDEVFTQLDKGDFGAKPSGTSSPKLCLVEFETSAPVVELAANGRLEDLGVNFCTWTRESLVMYTVARNCDRSAYRPRKIDGIRVIRIVDESDSANTLTCASGGLSSPHGSCWGAYCEDALKVCFKERSGQMSLNSADPWEKTDAHLLASLAEAHGVPAWVSLDKRYVEVSLFRTHNPHKEMWSDTFLDIIAKSGEDFQRIDCPK